MTARERRIVLVGAALVLTVALAARGVPAAARGVVFLREHAQERQAALARTRAVIAQTVTNRDSLSLAASQLVTLAPRLVGGRTRAEAAAALTALVSLDAGRSGLKVLRIAPNGDSASGILQPVRAVAELEGDIGGLVRLLSALERGDPLLTCASLGVTAPEITPRANAPETLRIEIEVQGWFLARTDP